MEGRRLYRLALIVVGVAAPARAQQVAPTFRVVLRPSVAMLPGRVAQVSYDLQFLSTAGDSLSEFAVRSPIPVQRVTAVSIPDSNLLVGTHMGKLDMASWAWLAALPRNGQTVTQLSYQAVGLPGIVRYRALRDVPVREAGPGELDDDPKPLGFSASNRDQVVGKTVGVVAFPPDQSSAGLRTWLRGQVREACALGWIDDPVVCRSILAKLSGNDGELRALPAELDAQRGKHVSEEAYVLVNANVAILLAKGAP